MRGSAISDYDHEHHRIASANDNRGRNDNGGTSDNEYHRRHHIRDSTAADLAAAPSPQ